MITFFEHQFCGSTVRVSQTLRNDRCQNILYKAVFEHFTEIRSIVALLLTSKSFQNSSFGANFLVNFLVNFVVEKESIDLLTSVLSPSSCFSLQFVPSVHIKQWWNYSDEVKRSIINFVGELVNTKYLHLSLRSLTLAYVTNEILSLFFGSYNNSSIWPQLQHLKLEGCIPNDTVLEIVSNNAPQLRTADFLRNSRITDAGVEHVSQLSGITALNLRFCDRITDTGLRHVAKLTGITHLNLGCCSKITDAGLAHISVLDGITSLNLLGCKLITDEGLEHLSKLSNITSLDLSNCKEITDRGVTHVCKLVGLTSLGLLNCCYVTVIAKRKLHAALPNCDISGVHRVGEPEIDEEGVNEDDEEDEEEIEQEEDEDEAETNDV